MQQGSLDLHTKVSLISVYYSFQFGTLCCHPVAVTKPIMINCNLSQACVLISVKMFGRPGSLQVWKQIRGDRSGWRSLWSVCAYGSMCLRLFVCVCGYIFPRVSICF